MTLQGPVHHQRAPSPIPMAVAGSCTRSSEDGSRAKEGEIQAPPRAPPHSECSCGHPVTESVTFLVSFLLLKYKMQEPISKAHMLKNIMQNDQGHFPEIRRASE